MKSKEYYITVNEKAVSVNSMYGRQGSRSFLSNEARMLQEAIKEAIEDKYGYDYEQLEGKLILKLHIEKVKKGFDLDNTIKVIQDGLVKCHVMIDDSQIFEIHAMKGEGFRDCIRIKIEEAIFQEFY